MNKHQIAPQNIMVSLETLPGTGKIQRKCACGNHTLAGGECAECHKKRLQGKAPNHHEPDTAPPIVHEVLRSSGQPLDPATRAFMEPRFGRDFSGVRVHTDGKAAQSAQSVNALAYTVGQDVVFDNGQYMPKTDRGRRLLAHELTHVMQQTRSGGIRLDRKKAPTNFGEFETTKFVESNSRGVEIILKFHPEESKVDAKKIALAQSVKATHEGGAAYVPNPTMANRMAPGGKPGAGYVIDASGKTNNPIYFDTKNLGPTENLKDTPSSANTSANPTVLGVNTHYELGHCYKARSTDAAKKKHPAGLYDQPQGRKKKGAGMMFETAAFAIDGADTGKYYGSVKWGYKLEGTEAAPTVAKIDIDEASKGTPTANFIEPAKLWNVGKTQGTLKVIADPATVYKMDGSTTETLAKETKIKQLDTVGGGTEAMIKAEVLNANGTGSGKLIFINVSDVKDMGDGTANKKLPV